LCRKAIEGRECKSIPGTLGGFGHVTKPASSKHGFAQEKKA